jgi:hypothetical protein
VSVLSGGSTAKICLWVQWLLQHASGKIILHKCVLFNITCKDRKHGALSVPYTRRTIVCQRVKQQKPWGGKKVKFRPR